MPLDPAVTTTGSETNFPNGLTSRDRPVPTDNEVQAAIDKAAVFTGVESLLELGLASGTEAKVTGKVAKVATGLTKVVTVFAWVTTPAAGAAFVKATVNAEEGKIDLEVLDSAFAESEEEVDVHWIAIREP